MKDRQSLREGMVCFGVLTYWRTGVYAGQRRRGSPTRYYFATVSVFTPKVSPMHPGTLQLLNHNFWITLTLY